MYKLSNIYKSGRDKEIKEQNLTKEYNDCQKCCAHGRPNWCGFLRLLLLLLFLTATANSAKDSDQKNGNTCDQDSNKREQYFNVPLEFKRE
tara:strand:- start:17 stop:289 length:273 start_codon:yes stop_codon:yes gene_type:complete